MLTFPGPFIVYKNCIEVVVVDEKHWGKFGSVENGEEWATAHFRVSVAIKNFYCDRAFWARCRDLALCVAIEHVATFCDRAICDVL